MVQPQKVRHKKSDGTRFNAHLSIERAAIFSPLGKKHKNPQCTHWCDSSSSIGKWISRTQTLVPLRAQERNQSDRCFFLFFSFFPRKFIRIVSLINSRHNQGRDRVFRGKKKKKRLAIFPFPKRFASLAFESLVQVEADGWRTWPSGRHDDCPPAMLLIRYSRGNLSERGR